MVRTVRRYPLAEIADSTGLACETPAMVGRRGFRDGMSESVVILGAGFLGRATAAAALAEGRPTTVLSRRVVPPVVGAEMVAGDFGDRSALDAAIRPGSTVVFAAGNSVPSADEHHPSRAVAEVTPLVSVLEAVSRTPETTLLFLSSGGAIYGEPDVIPVAETHELRPVSAYGAAKAACETYVRFYVRHHGVRATSLRCGNVYGPGQVPGRGQGLVGELIDASEEGRTVEIWGDGSVRRDFIHVDDLSHAIVSLCGHDDLPPALNLGSGEATSVREVVALVSEITGCPIDITTRPARPFDVQRVALDISRVQSLIDFKPMAIRDGIGRTWARVAAETVA